MPDQTKINFRGGQDVTVDGAVENVADALRGGGPVSLTTIHGGVIFVNWSSILYIEQIQPPMSEGAQSMVPPGSSRHKVE